MRHGLLANARMWRVVRIRKTAQAAKNFALHHDGWDHKDHMLAQESIVLVGKPVASFSTSPIQNWTTLGTFYLRYFHRISLKGPFECVCWPQEAHDLN
jgi:hypothetical protein